MKKVLALVLALVMMSCLSVTAFAAGGSTTITLTVPEHGGHTHTWGTEYSYDENGHWHTCSVCHEEKVGSREAHRGGYATTTAKAICEVCLTEYGELASNVASGFCGDPEVNSGNDVTWMLDSAGTLTISGTGDMANYPDNIYNATPWATERSNIKRIVIESGVTSIGSSAFKSCSAVEHIAISNTVTAVGGFAFRYCTSLHRIQLPDSITEMGDYVFQGCENLKFANIPNQLTTVPTAMFYECSKLIDVPIPSSVTVIEDYAFKDCPALTSVTIPEGVTEIGGYAFANCIALKAVVLPTTMTKIDSTAFAYIKNTAWIYYNGTKEQLDAMIASATLETQNFVTAYTNSQNAGRKIPPTSGNLGVMGSETAVKWVLENDTLTLTGSGWTDSWVTAPWYALKNSINKIVVGEGITNIRGSFGDHYHLTEISLPDSLAFCSDGLVQNCCELTDITLPDGITKVGISVFDGCDVLKAVALPETITTISNYAFCNCNELTDIYFGGTAAQWSAITVGTNNEPLANAIVHYGTDTIPTGYDITITGGAASVGAGVTITKATADTVITIIAGTAPTGQEFDKWEVVSGTGVTLANATSATTTFTMPANAVSIKATYKAHVHSGGTATCTAKAKCEVCGAEYGDLAAHDYSVPQHDGTQHWNKCASCDATDTKADHTGGDWLHDTEYHWKDCTVVGCGTIVASKAAHEFGTDKVCDICGYEKPATIVPKLLEGEDGKFAKGGKDGLSFRSSAEFADFISVSVNGHILESDKYTVKSGSTIVTLNADYLETLSAGSYTLTITSTTGSVDAGFTIEPQPTTDDPSTSDMDEPTTPGTDEPTSPQTGDTSNMFLWIALMFVSGIAFTGMIVFGKMKKSVR